MTLLRLLQSNPHISVAPTYLIITKWQFRLLSFLPQVGSTFSLFGTIAILYRILKIDRYGNDAINNNSNNNRRSYHRLLVAMNICDAMASMAELFGTAPVPKETLLEFARGNTATCTAQGFFIHTNVVSVLFYDAGLMIYFLLTIRYGWSERKVSKRAEPIIHVLALLIPYSIGFLAIYLKAFNPLGYGSVCGLSPYPLFCEYFGTKCERGQGSAKIMYTYFFLIPASILIIILYVSITLIYCSVRAQDRRAMAITSNRSRVRARTKAVAVQSWLFAFLFFNTWFYPVLAALLQVTVTNLRILAKVQYGLAVLESFFLPLHGFFTFLIYIRPRFVRFRQDDHHSIWMAAKLAAVGGRETSLLSSQRRRSSMMMNQRKRGSSDRSAYHHDVLHRQSADRASIIRLMSKPPITSMDGYIADDQPQCISQWPSGKELTENEEWIEQKQGNNLQQDGPGQQQQLVDFVETTNPAGSTINLMEPTDGTGVQRSPHNEYHERDITCTAETN